jgi:DNA segregation ATPase FtsK/SpoIIIE-like protein
VLAIRDGDGPILGPTGGTDAATLYTEGGQDPSHLVIDTRDYQTDDDEDADDGPSPDDREDDGEAEPDTTAALSKHTTNGAVLSLVTPTPTADPIPHAEPAESNEAPEPAPAGHEPTEPDSTTTGPDGLLTQAAEVVLRTQNASAAALARELHVRQTTTAELLTALENAGIVGEATPGKPRPVHFTPKALDDAHQQLAASTEHTADAEGSEAP